MPYHRELKDGNKVLVSKMLMLTKADAIYVANCMNAAYGDYNYIAKPNFLGYEGADYGVASREAPPPVGDDRAHAVQARRSQVDGTAELALYPMLVEARRALSVQ